MNFLSAAAVFVMCFLPRFFCLLFRPLPDPGWSHYWNLSTGLLRYGTLGYEGERVSNIEPGYPVFLAFGRVFLNGGHWGALLWQIAAASLGGVFLFHLTRHLARIESLTCHSEPFACHSERSEESVFTALEGKLREESAFQKQILRQKAPQNDNSEKTAWIAAGLFAFYPYLAGQSVMIIEVALFTTLLILCCASYIQMKSAGGAVLCGLIFAATLLTRMMIAPALFGAILILLVQKRWKQAAIICGVLAVCLGPYFLRNYSIDGSFIPPRSGWNLLQGNNPYASKVIPAYNPDLMDIYVSGVMKQEHPEWLDETHPPPVREVDRFFRDKAWQYMKAHPLETLKLKLLNVLYLFHPRIVPFYSMDENTVLHLKGESDIEVTGAPSRGFPAEAGHALYYGFILLTALPGFYLRRKEWRTESIFFLILLNFTLVYAYHWPATRLRAPLDFILIFYSAVTITVILSPSLVILSGAKNLFLLRSRVNSAKNLLFDKADSSAKSASE